MIEEVFDGDGVLYEIGELFVDCEVEIGFFVVVVLFVCLVELFEELWEFVWGDVYVGVFDFEN